MDIRFKCSMFITSFIPLWISIIVSDSWVLLSGAVKLLKYDSILLSIINICKVYYLCIIVIIIIIFVMISSISYINNFIREKKNNTNPPVVCIRSAVKSNKLSSEFLLAYILPMIAFDFADLKNLVLFSIYFTILAFLCIRNNNVYTNIFLEIKGYKMYICNLEKNNIGVMSIYEDCLVISKNNLTIDIGNNMAYWDFENNIYIDLR